MSGPIPIWRIRAARSRISDLQDAIPGAIAESDHIAVVDLLDRGASPVYRGGDPIARAVTVVREGLHDGGAHFGTHASYTLGVLVHRARLPPHSLASKEIAGLPALQLNFVRSKKVPRYRDRDGVALDPATNLRIYKAKRRRNDEKASALLAELFG